MTLLLVITKERGAGELIRWGRAFARSLGQRLVVLYPIKGSAEEKARNVSLDAEPEEPVLAAVLEAILELYPSGEAPEVEVLRRSGISRLEVVLEEATRLRADLVMVGKAESSRQDRADGQLARRLFEEAPCTTMLMRPGSSCPSTCSDILVPVAGGPHSKSALKLGHQLAEEREGRVVPLYVDQGIDDVSRSMSENTLNSIVSDLGLESHEDVQPRLEFSDQVFDAIGETASEGFDLVLMGASNIGSIRKILFGTVPDRFITGEQGLSIGIVRSEKPMFVRVRETIERWCDLTIPQLEREDRVALYDQLKSRSIWSFDFMALMGLATAIAALGLLQDSAAVVIGAMLVAPLMTPLLGAGLALVQGNLPLIRNACQSIIFGYLLALVIGMTLGWMVGLPELTGQLRARGGPTLLDLGVAFLSGVAAAYCVARPTLSAALPGVAIAAALVPPIATTGISLSMGEAANLRGSALLFSTNVVAIILGAAFSFYMGGIRANADIDRTAKWVRRTVLSLILVVAILIVPLSSVLISQLATGGAAWTVQVPETMSGLVHDFGAANFKGTVTDIRRREKDNLCSIEIELVGPEKPSPEDIQRLAELLQKDVGKTLRLSVHTKLVDSSIVYPAHEYPRIENPAK
ncbi:MAG: DUF389 domain-containing protein [Verrucomicrobiota bacterium]